ncbi:unnamed protein product [Effrenium voratum]|nr:unnamed protein product [Effrenium voratum]
MRTQHSTGKCTQTSSRCASENSQITLSRTLKACRVETAWDAALAVLSSKTGSRLAPDKINHSLAIRACSISWRYALRVAQEAFSYAIEPDAISYGCEVGAYQQSRNWHTSLLLLDAMADGTILPNEVISGSLIHACSSQWARVLMLLTRMGSWQVRLSTTSCNSLLSACERRWASGLALVQLARLAGLIVDTVTCNSSICACESANSWRPAMELLRGSFRLNIPLNIISSNAAISACAPHWTSALRLVRFSGAHRLASDKVTYGASISACAKHRQWHAAEHLLRLCTLQSVRHSTLILNALVTTWLLAAGMLLQMATRALAPSTVTMGSAMNACEEDGKWGQVLELFQELGRHRLERSDVTYNHAVTVAAAGSLWAVAPRAWPGARKHPEQETLERWERLAFAAYVTAPGTYASGGRPAGCPMSAPKTAPKAPMR